MRQRLLLLALTGLAGLAAGIAYDNPAHGDLVPSLTLPTITLPTLPGTTTVPTVTVPPLPPPPPLPPAPPPPPVTLPTVTTPTVPIPPAPPGGGGGGGGGASGGGAPPATGGGSASVSPQSAHARRVSASRTRFSTRGRRRGTTIHFRLRRPARVELVVVGPSPSCDVVGRKNVHGHAGENGVRFSGRIHGRPLAPGRYAIEIVTVRGGTRKRIGRIGIEVVRPGDRLTRREQSAPVTVFCGQPGDAAGQPLPAATVSATAPPTFGVAGATAQRSAPNKTSGPGVLRPPRLLPFGGDGGSRASWVVLGLAAALALAIAVYVVRAKRGPGEPTAG